MRGKVKDKYGTLVTWELISNKSVVVESVHLGISREFDGEGITHHDQVVRLIDSEVVEVEHYQVEDEGWGTYR